MQEVKQFINNVKNIYLIPSQEPEAITATMVLFYTLKELGKNVNLLLEKIPNEINFLAPSIDFISYPKNFVISIPNNITKVSQIYYEKSDEALKIHLTVENGTVKKEDISFYYSEVKPDLIITLGITDYQTQIKNMDAFGFLLDSPILNIDNKTDNKKFGKINLIEDKPLLETVTHLINNLNKSN